MIEERTLFSGHQIKLDNPIANNSPPDDKFTTSVVVFNSAAISLPAQSRDVEEKQAHSVDQLVTKTTRLFLQRGMLSYNAEAFVSDFLSGFCVVVLASAWASGVFTTFGSGDEGEGIETAMAYKNQKDDKWRYIYANYNSQMC